MKLLVNVLLEQPKRLERLILNLLRLIVTIWTLNLALDCLFPKDYPINFLNSTSIEHVNDLPFYDISLYFVLLIITWVILWGLVAKFLLPLTIKLLGFIIQWFIIRPLVFIYLLTKVLYLNSKKRKEKIPYPKFFEFSAVNEDENDNLLNRYQERSSSIKTVLSALDWLNRFTSSYKVYWAFLILIEYENTWLYSRIRQYYTILVLVFLGFAFFHAIYSYKYMYFSLLTLVLGVGFLIYLIDLMIKFIDSIDQYRLRDWLELKTYFGLVHEAIKDHVIILKYNIETENRVLKLSLKASNTRNIKTIFVFPINDLSISETISQINEIYKDTPERKRLLICDQIPDIENQTLLKKNKILFIYAENEEDVQRGLDKIQKLLLKG